MVEKEGLQAIQPKIFVPKTTDSAHGKRHSPNLLLDLEENRIFGSAITVMKGGKKPQ